jgi:hypothetical protein
MASGIGREHRPDCGGKGLQGPLEKRLNPTCEPAFRRGARHDAAAECVGLRLTRPPDAHGSGWIGRKPRKPANR